MGPLCSNALAGACRSPRCSSRIAALSTLLFTLLAAGCAKAAPQPEAAASVPAESVSLALPPQADGGDAAVLLVPAAEQAPSGILPDMLPTELPLASAWIPAEEPLHPAAEAAPPAGGPLDPFLIGTTAQPSAEVTPAASPGPGAAVADPFAGDSALPLAATLPAEEPLPPEAAALPAPEPLSFEATALPTAPGLPDDVAAVLGSGGTAAGSVEELPGGLPAATPPAPASTDQLPDPSKRTGDALLHVSIADTVALTADFLPGPFTALLSPA